MRPTGSSHVRRGGFTTIYVAVMLVAMLGFISLAVDWARVQLVKTELLHAADASARAAAVSFLTSGVSAAQSTAVSWAGKNTADGSTVTIDPTVDVEFGTWDSSSRKFTVLSGSARAGASAVRVWCRRTAATGNAVPTKFAYLVGCPTIDVRVSAIATASVNGGGIVGLDSVNLSGAAYVDGYDSSGGAYSVGSADYSGRVSSNGDVTLSGSSRVCGDVYYGTSNRWSWSGTSYTTGNTASLAAPLAYPAPTLPSSYVEGGALNLSGVATKTLSAGCYHFSSVSMSNSAVLNVTGPVTIYVDGAVNIGGASVVSVAQNRACNFRVCVTGTGGVTINNGSNVTADIYAPLSAASVMNAGGLSGAIVGKTLSVGNSGCIHYDESLGYGTAGAILVSTLK